MFIENSSFTSPTTIHVMALPPAAQEAVEKEAILQDPRFAELMEKNPTQEFVGIQKSEWPDERPDYQIMTKTRGQDQLHLLCTVHVLYLPREDGLCGPARFDFEFIDRHVESSR